MELHEIENLSFRELKARRGSLVEAAKGAPPDDLAQRYVQARMDAKQRDEKLGEQADTLTALKTGLTAADEKAKAAEGQAAGLREEIVKMQEAVEATQTEILEQIEHTATLLAKMKTEQQRSARLKVQADKFTAAISSIHKIAMDAIQSQATDDADQGE